MCAACESEKKTLPSIEHFQLRIKNPKVYFLFYDYFFRAVVGETKWKINMQEKNRLGTSIAEAFTHALIENNYFAWLMEYQTTANTKVMTEYTEMEEEGDKGEVYTPKELEGVEFVIPLDAPVENQNEEQTIYQVLYKDREGDKEQYKAGVEERKETQDDIGEEARSEGNGNMELFNAMQERLDEYRSNAQNENENERNKRKRKSMRDLKVHTGKAMMNNERMRRSTDKHYMFMEQMKQRIKQDVAAGRQKKFEDAYRTMCGIIKEEKSKQVGAKELLAPYVVDDEAMYDEI